MAAMAEQFGETHRFDALDLSQPKQIAQWCETLLKDCLLYTSDAADE